ncbi:hypothetical protein B0J12DRAFT_699438 [Macrophomina phaseolina]|uniref:Six-bladed beta-propeller TolB-like protein n=1 Tax=Macrophomina phaseolina TaxID=35725 RepID=A0ABQ8GD60_9PEZI|nr:hypothetical protein B0J12DRAFT_699438 [Macrophomina phaseolina]
MILTFIFLSTIWFISSVEVSATVRDRTTSILRQFANGTSVENIAVRENGNLLVTLLYQAEVLELSPHPKTDSRLVHYFNGSTRVNGISELSPDVFAVSANHDTIWTLDLTAGTPKVAQVVTIANASFLNGVTTLDGSAGTVLVADSGVGIVWLVDTTTGEYKAVHQDVTMAAATAPSSSMALGVNGARYKDGVLYYTNTGKQLFCRVRIDPVTGGAIGPYEVIAEGLSLDDLVPMEDAAFVAGSSAGVLKIFFNGTQEVVVSASNSTDIAGATAVAFGRTPEDSDRLYVTTSGGGLGGGKVVAIEI